MAYQLPGIADFKSLFPQRDFPYAVPLFEEGGSGAVAKLTIGGPNNSVIAAAVTAGGASYPKAPTVIVFWGKGTGAVLRATLTSGVVDNPLTIVEPGYGYTDPSTISVYFSSGYGDNTITSKVTDYDLARALRQAISFNMSTALWGSQSAFTMAYCYLAAHYLCEDAQNSGAGLAGQSEWVRNSKTVGDVTDSFNIPDRIMRSPYLAKLSKTTYGSKFLELISPSLVGNFQSYHRCTLP